MITDVGNEQKSSRVAADIVRRARHGRPNLGRVLDVGCGIGAVLCAARGDASSLTGVDVSESFLAEASRALPEARLSRSSVAALPFEDASFDTIFFCDVIEHLDDPVQPLREIKRVLAPGGVVLITTPNSNAVLRYVLGRAWPGLSDPSHILFFTKFSLRHVLAMVGFMPAGDGTLAGSGIRPIDIALEALRNGGTLVAISTIA